MASPNRLISHLASLCFIAFAFVSMSVRAQTGPAESSYNNVVSISTARSGTPPQDWAWAASGIWTSETGTGVIVARDGLRIKAITAMHMVDGDPAVTTIVLHLRGLAGIDVHAKRLASSDALDMALVEATLPSGTRLREPPAPMPYRTSASLKRAEPVWTIDGQLDSVPNTITRLDEDSDVRKFLYTANSTGRGFSGGPVLDGHGQLVGIHTGLTGEPTFSVATKIEAAIAFFDTKGYEIASMNLLKLSASGSASPAAGSDPFARLREMGLRYDAETFNEAVQAGTIPAIQAFLDAGMSAQAVAPGSDRFEINTAAYQGVENFPEVLKVFLDHKLDFKYENHHVIGGLIGGLSQGASADGWFYSGTPETLQDQLWLTLASSREREAAVRNGKALLAAGASPERALRTAQRCSVEDKGYCEMMKSYLAALGYKSVSVSRQLSGASSGADGSSLYEGKQFTQAKPSLEASARAGDAHSAALVATYYVYGLGQTPVDERQAMAWLLKSAQLGEVSSMRGMGYAYLVGGGVAVDYKQSLHWFHRASDSSDGPSMTAVAYLYFLGLGVGQSYADAGEWFLKGKSAGDAAGEGLQNVLESTGAPGASKGSGKVDGHNPAWISFRNAILDNRPTDYRNLAIDYQGGEDGVGKDAVNAVRFYEEAAKLGDKESMFALYALYSGGKGVAEDDRKARFWLQKSANSGGILAECALGSSYAYGSGGFPQDDPQAVVWFRKCAEGGDAQGMRCLAIMYHSGRGGLPRDSRQALLWYQKAAALGDPAATKMLSKLPR